MIIDCLIDCGYFESTPPFRTLQLHTKHHHHNHRRHIHRHIRTITLININNDYYNNTSAAAQGVKHRVAAVEGCLGQAQLEQQTGEHLPRGVVRAAEVHRVRRRARGQVIGQLDLHKRGGGVMDGEHSN